jgi:hypothetical protein
MEPRLDQRDAGKCRDEFRLVLQPFTVKGIFIIAHDLAIHLTYDLVEASKFLSLSERWDRTSAEVTDKGPVTIQGSVRCGRDLRRQLEQSLRKFARHDKLLSIAWMATSLSGQHWTFGRFRIVNDQLVATPVSGAGFFDNFSKPMLLAGDCPINEESPTNVKIVFGCNVTDQSDLRILEQIKDGRKLRRPEDKCVVCHLSEPLLLMHDKKRINDVLGLPIFSANGVDLSNLKQFGYDHKGYPSVSSRLIGARKLNIPERGLE